MGFIFRMSKPIERKPLAVVLADKLEEEIRTGQLKGYVAGRRILAKRYGVNEKTASAALNVLSKKGLLADAESGKRRKIITQDIKPAAKAASKRLLILHQANTPLPVEDVLLLRDVQDSWEANGGPVSWARVDFGRYKKPGRVLDGVIDRYGADAVVLMSPTVHWSTEAARRLPTFQFGGAFSANPSLSLCSFALDSELVPLIQFFVDQGHRKIFVPTPNEELVNAIQNAYRSVFGDSMTQSEMDELVQVFPERVPQAWRGYWKKALMQVNPTAVMLLDDNAMLSLYGFCAEVGIKIPRDLSVLSLSYDERFEWMQPVPVMTRFPIKKAIKLFKSWMRGGLESVGKNFLQVELRKGESIGPARKGV
ncbi:DNA-binding transcriptional regulator, LacI/PurR family [Rubritalea squalenifaciens DSM 18772]|uniref:DNA-binding transcriptional regulator, LacI/PurR family n=2 Tax=Rubritalea squalenifaciens TaxID=407226 RepID=A0A1M6QFC8_9BACT|nr:DNA-binding transcriptional regulator, LacI/PurR family [Rubritalea squalenifaciens DSM 18772]